MKYFFGKKKKTSNAAEDSSPGNNINTTTKALNPAPIPSVVGLKIEDIAFTIKSNEEGFNKKDYLEGYHNRKNFTFRF